jgi:hypothetical protein
MNCHQILSGACNAGDRCFAVGSVEGIPFTVCVQNNIYYFIYLYINMYLYTVNVRRHSGRMSNICDVLKSDLTVHV